MDSQKHFKSKTLFPRGEKIFKFFKNYGSHIHKNHNKKSVHEIKLK